MKAALVETVCCAHEGKISELSGLFSTDLTGLILKMEINPPVGESHN